MSDGHAGWVHDPRYADIQFLYPNIQPTTKRMFKDNVCRSCGSLMSHDAPMESLTDWNNTYYQNNKTEPNIAQHVTYHFCDNCGNMCQGSPKIFSDYKNKTIWLYDCDGDLVE